LLSETSIKFSGARRMRPGLLSSFDIEVSLSLLFEDFN
jgi:hypothetical protein